MKALYKITNSRGVTLCFQVADGYSKAIDIAKMYGHKTASMAEWVRSEA